MSIPQIWHTDLPNLSPADTSKILFPPDQCPFHNNRCTTHFCRPQTRITSRACFSQSFAWSAYQTICSFAANTSKLQKYHHTILCVCGEIRYTTRQTVKVHSVTCLKICESQWLKPWKKCINHLSAWSSMHFTIPSINIHKKGLLSLIQS